MNCSIVNASPQNFSIDAADMGNRQRNAFKFTFYGDRTIGADYYIYDTQTNKKWGNRIFSDYAASNKKDYYYNTEEIDTVAVSIPSNNNKSFVWKVRVYDDVDLSNSKYPNIKITSGAVKDNPFITGKTLSPVIVYENGKPVVNTLMLNLDTTKTITLPSWIIINGERRIIKEVRAATDVSGNITHTRIKLRNPFTTEDETGEIPEGTGYTVTPYQTYTPTTDTTGIFIAPNIAIDEDETTDHRGNFISSIENLPYPNTSQYCYYLEIDGTYYPIKTYNRKSGSTILATSLSSVPDTGTPYNLYCSYVESPFFYFTTEPTPVISDINAIVDAEVMKFTAKLTSMSFTKYQYWEIYDVTYTNGNITSNSILAEKSENIYMGALEFVFRGYLPNHSYKAKLQVVTQTDWSVTATSQTAVTATATESNIKDVKVSYNREVNAPEISFTHINPISGSLQRTCGTKVMRQEYGSNYIEYVSTISYPSINAGRTDTFIDYTAVSKKKYMYYLLDFTSSTTESYGTMYLPTTSDYFETDFYTYTIYFLQEQAYQRFDVDTDKRVDYDYMYAERSYIVTDIVRPELNVVDKHSISHNIGRNTYVGYARKASVAAWQTTYDTFSLSFQLGNTVVKYPEGTEFDRSFTKEFANSINYGWCEVINDDEKYYSYFKSLVASGAPVMIKDYRGEKWFGSITSHNSEIDNLQPIARSITEKIDFAETYPIEKVRILNS